MKKTLILCFSLFFLFTISCNTAKQAKVTTIEKTSTEQLESASKTPEPTNKVGIQSAKSKSKKQISASQLKKINDAGIKKLPKGTKKEGGN